MSAAPDKGPFPARASQPDEHAPRALENPFLAPAWMSTQSLDLTRPVADLKGTLTKEQLRVYEAGQSQLLSQHIQHQKAAFGIAASGQIEDLSGRVYVHVAGTMAERIQQGQHPATVQPYLDLYLDASLRRFAPELLQLASDHHRSQHDLAAEVVQTEHGRGFWSALKTALKSR